MGKSLLDLGIMNTGDMVEMGNVGIIHGFICGAQVGESGIMGRGVENIMNASQE